MQIFPQEKSKKCFLSCICQKNVVSLQPKSLKGGMYDRFTIKC